MKSFSDQVKIKFYSLCCCILLVREVVVGIEAPSRSCEIVIVGVMAPSIVGVEAPSQS